MWPNRTQRECQLPVSHHFDEFSEEVMICLNRACNRFEQRWQAGERPNVEEMLVELDVTYRAALTCRLRLSHRGRFLRSPTRDAFSAETLATALVCYPFADRAASPDATKKRTRVYHARSPQRSGSRLIVGARVRHNMYARRREQIESRSVSDDDWTKMSNQILGFQYEGRESLA